MPRLQLLAQAAVLALMTLAASCWGGRYPEPKAYLPKPPIFCYGTASAVSSPPYHCERGLWVIDTYAIESEREYQEDRRKLYFALRTRILTDKEMERVRLLGIDLVVEPMESYLEANKLRELNEALLQQAELRIRVNKARRDQ